jgi:hypothetical protein
MFACKVRDHIGDRQYERLRKILRESTGVEIGSLLSTRNFLREILHLDMVHHHRCPENHIAYCGKYERYIKCPYCNSWRFFEHSKELLPTDDLSNPVPSRPADEEDTDWLPFHHLKPNAIYHYIPLIHRLRLLYADATSSREVQTYLEDLKEKSNPNEKRDVWDGRIISSL